VQWPKSTNFGQIKIFGILCTDPLLPMRAKFGMLEQTYGICLRAKFRLNRFILSPFISENPKFAIFCTSVFCDVASWRQSEKVEHGCTSTNLSLSNGIKIVSVLQPLHGTTWRTTLTFKAWWTNSEPDRQTDKKLDVFGLAPLKRLGFYG